jgi:predicted AAA+ superfamily ATPase
MKRTIEKIIRENHVDAKHVFYVSLDDYQLQKNSIHEIVEEFRKINRIKFKERIFLFLDEVTFKDNYELQLKNLADSQPVKIFASASGALLVRNKNAHLTGRHFDIEVNPLTFSEYLDFKKISIRPADEGLRKSYFEEFLKTGGVPAYVLYGDPDFLSGLVDDIIYKDIAAGQQVRDVRVLKDFFLLLMERSGKQFSINKIANILNLSPDTSRRYLDMFAETYLIHLMERHGKTNERILSPRKVYAGDLGIRCMFTGLRDKGSLFENYIYLRLRNSGPRYLYQNRTEIDFYLPDKTLIEVKYHNEPLSSTQERLFNSYPASRRMIIRQEKDLDEQPLQTRNEGLMQ